MQADDPGPVGLDQEAERRQIDKSRLQVSRAADLATRDRNREACTTLEVGVRGRRVHREGEPGRGIVLLLGRERPREVVDALVRRANPDDHVQIGDLESHPKAGGAEQRAATLICVHLSKDVLDQLAQLIRADSFLHVTYVSEEGAPASHEVLVDLRLDRLTHLLGDVEDETPVLGGLGRMP